MRLRVASIAISLPILLFVLFMGGNYIIVGAALLSFLGLYELYTALKKLNFFPMMSVGFIATLVLYFISFINMPVVFYLAIMMALLFFVMILNVLHRQNRLIDAVLTFIGVMYISFSLLHVVLIDKIDNNFFIWTVFLLAFMTDTFAYLSGRKFGRHKLLERVSPKKTMEGAIGGIIGCVVVIYIFSLILKPEFAVYSIGFSIIGSILAQFGDLVASKIKRYCGIKDFGYIMPGHGGMLDRFDSILFTAPYVYYVILLIDFIKR